jgi:hypothetical protein
MWRFYPHSYHAARSAPERIGKGLHELNTLLQMGLRNPENLLDWGCGGGELVEVLQMLGKVAYGYDPFAAGSSPSGAVLPDLQAVTALLPRVRTVTLLDVLEHLHDPGGLLGFLREHSRADVYVFVPRGDCAEVRKFRGHAYIVQSPSHLFLPTSSALANLAARAGYDLRLCAGPTSEFWELDWRLRFGGRVFAGQGRESLRDRLARRLAQTVLRVSQPQRRGGSAHLAAVLRPVSAEGLSARS